MLIATLCLPKNQSLINFNAFKESAESAVLSNSLRFEIHNFYFHCLKFDDKP